MTAVFDALVVGAGPAGSTAARLLADAGWSVALVEKTAFPRRKVCGEFISATSFDTLDLAGVGEAFAAQAGPPIRRVSLFSGETSVSSAMPPATGAAGPWGRALGREHLDTLLRDAAVAAGAALFQPFQLTAADFDGVLYRARIESKSATEIVAARSLICANGSWGHGVLAPPRRAHRPSDLLAFKAHFLGGALAEALMPLLMFPGGYGGMVRSDAGRLSLSCCITRQTLARCRAAYPALPAGEAVLAHIQNHCAGVRQATSRAELAGPVLAAGPIRPGVRVRNQGRMFRVGNAAGEAHPIIAEGISMAMQSSALLCQHLIEAGPEARVGDRYAADWRGQFEPRLRAAQALASLAIRTPSRRLLTAAIEQAPGLLTWGARMSGKTVLLSSRAYARSPTPSDGRRSRSTPCASA